jgi:hypothetical protein
MCYRAEYATQSSFRKTTQATLSSILQCIITKDVCGVDVLLETEHIVLVSEDVQYDDFSVLR